MAWPASGATAAPLSRLTTARQLLFRLALKLEKHFLAPLQLLQLLLLFEHFLQQLELFSCRVKT